MTIKTIGQKLYEKLLAIKAGTDALVVVRAIDPGAPQGYSWLIALPLENGCVVPLARLLTGAEIERLSPRHDDPLTQRVAALLTDESDDLATLSPQALIEVLDARPVDLEWGVPQPFGGRPSVEA